MKKQFVNDLKNRRFFKKAESKNLGYKILLRSKHLSYIENTQNFSKNECYFSRIKNRCFLTFRSKGIIRLTKLSRIKFKELCNYGLILGIKPYKW